MKKFQFRLERLRKLRERAREERRLALAQVLDYRAQVERKIDQTDGLRVDEVDQLRERLTRDDVAVDQVIASRVYDQRLQQYREQLVGHRAQVDAVAEWRRGQLLEAERSHKVLDKLEQKSRERFEAEANRAEQQEMDELAVQTNIRKTEIQIADPSSQEGRQEHKPI